MWSMVSRFLLAVPRVAGYADFSPKQYVSCSQAHSVVGGCPVGKEEGG
jgi:hypothetical protein